MGFNPRNKGGNQQQNADGQRKQHSRARQGNLNIKEREQTKIFRGNNNQEREVVLRKEGSLQEEEVQIKGSGFNSRGKSQGFGRGGFQSNIQSQNKRIIGAQGVFLNSAENPRSSQTIVQRKEGKPHKQIINDSEIQTWNNDNKFPNTRKNQLFTQAQKSLSSEFSASDKENTRGFKRRSNRGRTGKGSSDRETNDGRRDDREFRGRGEREFRGRCEREFRGRGDRGFRGGDKLQKYSR